ncbi:MAG: FtsX-like permease family protein [Chloroflexia bacterium]
MESIFGVSMDILMAITLGLSLLVVAIVVLLAWRKPILTQLALRNIPRRRSQTVLIVLGLMLATLLTTAAFGTGDTMSYSMRQAFTAGLGGTDLQVRRVNPVVAQNGPPDFNRPVPAFETSIYEDLKNKVGDEARIDGWSAQLQQVGPLVDTNTKQGAGQTFITGVGSDMRETMGALRTIGGASFDVASIGSGEIVLDKSAVDKLGAEVGHTVQVVVAGKPNDFKVKELVEGTSPTSQFPAAYINLSDAQRIFNAPGQVTEMLVSLRDADGLANSVPVAEKLRGLVDTTTFTVEETKKDGLAIADLIGSLFTTIFLGTALFSIAAGILLIFLIFSMLAAERKSEMGMARAVGIQRGHLTQMFIFEGLAYDIAAAAVGAALGVAVGWAMVGIISGLVGTFGFRLTPHVEIRSIVVAYCLGMLVTFLTVSISAARVSRLNIVSAIRDIPDVPKPDSKLMEQVKTPFRQLKARQPLGFIGGIFSLIASLFKSGPVTGTLGLLLLVQGLTAPNGFAFHTGATLSIIALGLTIRWLLARGNMRRTTRDRIAFTIAGALLVIYWALPINSLHDWFGVPKFDLGFEQFFVGGIAMVAGAVWIVMYNADVLLGALSFVLGRVGRMRPVLKTAVAYPMAAIFRTGMAIAMFSLIMFVLIVISVLTQINQQVDPNKPEVSGGYDIQAIASFANPIQDINAGIEADPNLRGKFDAVGGQTLFPLQMRQPGHKPSTSEPDAEDLAANPGFKEGWRFYNARFVDDAYLESNLFSMMIRAEGYSSDREIWEAIRNDPTLVVVDSTPIIYGELQDSAGAEFGPLFTITGVKTEVTTMKPVEIELQAPGVPGAKPTKVKVIGVLSRFSNFYTGLYVNREIAQQVVPFPVPATNYFLRVKAGESPQELRRALGTAFLSNGLEPVVIADELKKRLAVSNGLNGLLQGFLALGLLVGVAALGVITTRAVVERRQQIGVLRAIGYQRGMVGASFLLESSFISLLGILIGVGLGLISSYQMVQFFREDTPTVQFQVPWLQIGLIVLVTYIVSLVTTIMPARNASKIYPAEALRYE